jgi:hypothetical protein
LEAKADAFEKYYRMKSRDLNDLKFALSIYELASNLITKIKKGYQSESSQLRLGEQSYRIYNKAISTSLQLYDLTGSCLYKEKAFTFSEFNKASILLQCLSEAKAKKFAGIPSSLLEKERDLKIDLAFYEKNLIEEKAKGNQAESSAITQLQDKLFSLNQKYDTLVHNFETEYPEYYNLKYRNFIASPKEIQKKLLDNNDAIVEYFIGDASIYIFTLNRQNLDITTVNKDSLFEKEVRAMKEGLVKRNYDLYSDNAYQLYKTLIKPIKKKIAGKNLIIIPDGILGYIPFETLLTKKADKVIKGYRQLAYLIKNHQITYDYSSTLLYENMTKERNKSSSRYIGFAPVTFK